MIFENHQCDNFLKDHIESFIYFKHYKPDHSLQRMVPDGYIYLVFELDGMERHEIDNETLEKKALRTRCWLSGMHTNYITITALQDSEMFVIQFKAHGLYPFIHQPVNQLNNQIVTPEPFFGEGIFDFRKELLDIETPEIKFTHCESWLTSLYKEELQAPAGVLYVHDTIRTTESLELNSIVQLIEETGYSRKHFTNQFKKHVGLTPKQLQRIIRFNELLVRIQKKETIEWAQIALSCGYYDQAHFIKEFKLFCGFNPGEFIVNYKDYEASNFFPLD